MPGHCDSGTSSSSSSSLERGGQEETDETIDEFIVNDYVDIEDDDDGSEGKLFGESSHSQCQQLQL
jgi:hypothetical protein